MSEIIPVTDDADRPQSLAVLSPVERMILALNPDSPVEAMLNVLDFVQAAKAELKRLDALADARGIEWIEHNKRSISYERPDGMRAGYFIKDGSKKTKCKDRGKALMAVIEATGGDTDRLAELLSSDPLKHGACKNVLTPEKYAEIFETTVTSSLEAGTPVQLAKYDDRFRR